MMDKKLLALFIVSSFLMGNYFSTIYAPDNLDHAFFYKIYYSFSRFAGIISRKLANSLSIGHEASNFRTIIDSIGYVASKLNCIRKQDVEINNVKVRIFSRSKSKLNEKTPLMIFIHGGGHAFRFFDSYDEILDRIVSNLSLKVISIDYRLSPEYSYPTQFDDCYSVVKYVLENADEFNVDTNRIVLAGDSAGSLLATNVAHKLWDEYGRHVAKLQVLIYPWVQKVVTNLPSDMRYTKTGLVGSTGVEFPKYTTWYLGVKNFTQEMLQTFQRNEILKLIDDDEQFQRRVLSYLDVNNIDEAFKRGQVYYETYKNFIFVPKDGLSETSILKQEPKLAKLYRKLFEPHFSPLFADDDYLRTLPKTYMVILEWDTLKDEGLLFAGRLKQAGVQVETAFYENAFHGIINFIQPGVGFNVGRKIIDDLIVYLSQNL